MLQHNVRSQGVQETEAPPSAAADRQSTKRSKPLSRKRYEELVAQYFEYAHSNRLEEVVAMFTDDAFATFVVAPEPFHGKEAIRGFYEQLFRDFPHIEPEIFAVIIDGDRAVTEQRMTIVRPDGTRVVMPFNTNHFHFEGELIKTLRVMSSPA